MNTDTVARRLFEASLNNFEWLCHQTVSDFEDFAQSEIELLFLAALMLENLDCSNVIHTEWDFPKVFHIVEGNQDHSSDARIIVRTQFPWRNYKIDFCFQPKSVPFCVFVECDGHDFHERTKEQAEHDRSKDRLIQSEGIAILRFTGREIWRDAPACVREVIQFMGRKVRTL